MMFTRHYEDFCRQAFGKFLHHTPAAVLTSQRTANTGLRRTWWFACKEETINPLKPTRLPLLFALDAKLKLADGFHYVPNCDLLKDKKSDATSSSVNCNRYTPGPKRIAQLLRVAPCDCRAAIGALRIRSHAISIDAVPVAQDQGFMATGAVG